MQCLKANHQKSEKPEKAMKYFNPELLSTHGMLSHSGISKCIPEVTQSGSGILCCQLVGRTSMTDIARAHG